LARDGGPAVAMSSRRRWAARIAVLLVVCGLAAPAGVAAVTGGSNQPAELERGTVRSAANGSTVVSVQGFHFEGRGSAKKPARLVSVGPGGETEWAYDGEAVGAKWFYDVDPLPDGDLLVTATNETHTKAFALDRETREREWSETFAIPDAHDVAAINDTHLVVAHKDNYNRSAGRSDDRVFVYDRTTDTVTWEWVFREHLSTGLDGGMDEDWSHVNDVDVLADGRLLVSLRNFDQVLVVDRATKDVVHRLGSDGDHDVLHEQHNPDFLVAEDGTPTVLVADSENDRVVEYALRNGTWERTWSVGSSRSLSWPRDADRLPNGNTLVVDSLNHRIIEVTPRGEIVWEFYATWGPYDAERVAHGGGSNGPTMADLGAGGHHAITGSAGDIDVERGPTFATWVAATAFGTPLEGPATAFASRWSHVAPWVRPAWLNSWDFAALAAGALAAAGWGLFEVGSGLLGWLRGRRSGGAEDGTA